MRRTGAFVRWPKEEMSGKVETGVGARAPAIQVIVLVSSVSFFSIKFHGATRALGVHNSFVLASWW